MNLTCASDELQDKAVIDALIAQDGLIYAHSLPRIPGHFNMNRTDMYESVQRLGRRGIILQRVDAGGEPCWGLKEVKSSNE